MQRCKQHCAYGECGRRQPQAGQQGVAMGRQRSRPCARARGDGRAGAARQPPPDVCGSRAQHDEAGDDDASNGAAGERAAAGRGGCGCFAARLRLQAASRRQRHRRHVQRPRAGRAHLSGQQDQSQGVLVTALHVMTALHGNCGHGRFAARLHLRKPAGGGSGSACTQDAAGQPSTPGGRKTTSAYSR